MVLFYDLPSDATACTKRSSHKGDLFNIMRSLQQFSQIIDFPTITRNWSQLNNDTIQLMSTNEIEECIYRLDDS